MSRSRRFARSSIALGIAAIAMFALSGCAAPGEAASEEPTNPAPSAEPTVIGTPSATPSAAPVDPADVTTWTITTGGMGPIQRGAPAEATLAGLTAFETDEYCPGRIALSADGAATLLVIHPEGVDEVSAVWANGRPDADGVLPASPATEAGIELGSTMDELTAAYPELEPTNQPAAESFGYAVGDDASGYVNFLVEDDTVVMIGVQERAGVPKEFCG
ncbi:hypothetical protein [Agromyces lapidis]|uniref:Uncharacterized protein n=1 Tax=Agromyces lapidis TaxID=279574 RepID=A0ABV5SSR2_9MICO|nr:hypothetical protein [Agromyces lapidis]